MVMTIRLWNMHKVGSKKALTGLTHPYIFRRKGFVDGAHRMTAFPVYTAIWKFVFTRGMEFELSCVI